jgi:DNA-binding transcriptional ArsR family regulator
MSQSPSRRDLPSDANTVKALRSPLRVQLLRHMRGKDQTSPTELARELGVELGTMSYHVRMLHRLGFLELRGRRRVRGAALHLYALRPGVDDLIRTIGTRALDPDHRAWTTATVRVDRRALPGLRAEFSAIVDRMNELDALTPAARRDPAELVTVDLRFAFDVGGATS